MTGRRCAALVLALAAVLACVTTPADAGYTPPLGTSGNRPAGTAGSTTATQYAQVDQFIGLVDQMGKGDEGYVGMYSNSQTRVTDAILAADQRGAKFVYVTFTNRDHPIDGQNARLRDGLGETKGSSFKVCHDSCGGSGDTMHLKIAGLKVKGHTYWMGGSGNFSHSSSSTQFVQWSWFESGPLFAQARDKVTRMTSDKTDRSCTKVTDSKLGVTVVYMPCKTANPMLDLLDDARCYPGARMYVGMFLIGPSAKHEVEALLRCKKAGGDVRLIGHPNHWSTSRISDLLDGGRVSSKYKGVSVPVYDSLAENGDYVHDKYEVVDAKDANGHRLQEVISGSYDWGSVSRTKNDNFVLLQHGPAIVRFETDRFLFEQGYAKRVPR